MEGRAGQYWVTVEENEKECKSKRVKLKFSKLKLLLQFSVFFSPLSLFCLIHWPD